MYQKSLKKKEKIFAVAPMMDWTDRHCRFFHRQLTSDALLYTEMVVADAAIHGDRERLLGYNDIEHPVALQLGGSDPDKLGQAAQIGANLGYDEINLNVGCPSDRVQSGTFGACLMREPELVASCVAAMKSKVVVPVTVKCRIGVDDQDPEVALDVLAKVVFAEGADALWIHARKAWLEGLSPKENRDIPPLDYDRVYRLKQKYSDKFIGINGGIEDIERACSLLDHVDGVMLGRAAYRHPSLLAGVDRLWSSQQSNLDYEKIIDIMAEYADRHISQGGQLNHVTRHMIGLFSGYRGARQYRQILSTKANLVDATSSVLREAFSMISLQGNSEDRNAA